MLSPAPDAPSPETASEPRLHALAAHLSAMPVLAESIAAEIAPHLSRQTTDAEFRAIRRAAVERIVARHKEAATGYRVWHFLEEVGPCPEPECQVPVSGAYMEIVNPVTRAGMMLPGRLAHAMLHHGMGLATEPLQNMGNSPYGEAPLKLDAAALLKVFKDIALPPEAEAELLAWKAAYPIPVKPKVQYEPGAPNDFEQEHGIEPFFNVLAALVDGGAADIHIKAGHPPCGVLRGQVTPFTQFPVLTPEVTYYYLTGLMSPEQKAVFDAQKEMDLAFPVPGIGRFRCNVYQAAGAAGSVLRVISDSILPAEALGLPPVLKKTVFERQGLILITGQTGSGKTTTLAALLEFANQNRKIHVLTLENPVEFVYEPKAAIFTQREMEVDSMSFTGAMRGALRQKPDIILIGEMRDAETITMGLKAAETGHLVMSTLHTNDAVQTINRLINTFPPHEQEAVRIQLASSLKASVAQRLIPRADKPGRCAAIECLLVTPNARGENTKTYILRGNSDALYQVIKTSGYDGMQSMNQALFKHYANGLISADDALANSDNPDELTRLMREHAGLAK